MPDLTMDPTDTVHNQVVAFFEIEHEDVFHLKNLYKLIFDWFSLYKFTSLEGDDKPETLYFQRVLGNGNLEHHIWWRLQHIPEKSTYFKYFIKFDFQTLNMGKSEVTSKGKKYSTNKGDLIVRCKAWLMLDYNKEWRNHAILKGLEPLFIKRIYKNKIEDLQSDLWMKVYRLQDEIKQYMQLKTGQKLPKPFHPELGV